MAIDVTDRIRAADKIAEQAALLDIATDGIIERDMNDMITFWNRGAETMYGWKKSEAEGKRVRELLFTYNGAQFDEAVAALSTRDAWSAELHQTTKEGRNIVVQSRWTTVHDQFGKPKSILILNTDITEKKKFEAQFLRAQRMESIGTLASGIAHDLNNVLSPVMLTLQSLRRKLPDERSRRLLNSVELSARRGAEMVQQVLTFARGADGERILLQPKHIVAEIEKIVRETFVRSIRIRVRSAENVWNVRGDATQLHQVLMNLCVNARDAMLSGGTLEIEIENFTVDEHFSRLHVDAHTGEYVRISVTDTGAGIPPEIIDKIFEPFFTTKEIGRGTGLGLSTVVAIVKSHGGFISVYSEVGKGATFRVYIPAVVTERDVEPSEFGDEDLPMGNGELVLIVDDEVSICEITKETLENFGYRALTAFDGEEAVRVYNQRKGDIDVILTDMMMPSLDGPTLIRELRKIDTKVRIIGASGLVGSEKHTETPGEGMQAFLQKPFTAEKLLRTLRTVIDGAAV
jgi:PAS domain S-box-containing protein